MYVCMYVCMYPRYDNNRKLFSVLFLFYLYMCTTSELISIISLIAALSLPWLCLYLYLFRSRRWISFHVSFCFSHSNFIETYFCCTHRSALSCLSRTKFGHLLVQCPCPFSFTSEKLKEEIIKK